MSERTFAPNISLGTHLEMAGSHLISLSGFIRGLKLCDGQISQLISTYGVIKDAREELKKLSAAIDQYERLTGVAL